VHIFTSVTMCIYLHRKRAIYILEISILYLIHLNHYLPSMKGSMASEFLMIWGPQNIIEVRIASFVTAHGLGLKFGHLDPNSICICGKARYVKEGKTAGENGKS
jgi:hypothetical protein